MRRSGIRRRRETSFADAAAGNKRDSHVHVQISVDLDPRPAVALGTKLKECTDDQILAEIARRGIDRIH